MNQTFTNETGSAVYCAGCNGCFLRAAANGHCPQCGATVHSLLDTDAPISQLIRDIPAPADDGRVARSDEDIDRRIGTTLHVYQLESLIGRGGMGRVYLARHVDLHRMCALKILSPKLSTVDADYVMRFQHEGRAAAALNHPNIVTTHAIGEAEGFHFLEMEFVAGRSLQQLIMDEGRLPPERATILAAAIADGLATAHREGILHRDLKPDNVLLTQRGVPKIGDFGLAKRIAATSGPSPEKLVGTPHFMAPELFQGVPATPASDVYALGICYFVMLTGRFPFVRGSFSQLKEAVIHDPLPNVRALCEELSLEMAECVSLLLSKSPANRPASGTEAMQLLRAVLGDVRDVDSLLADAFADFEGVQWKRRGNVYHLDFSLPDGRRQSLFVENSRHAAANRLLLLYSICCPADPAYYEYALRLNSEIPHGGLAIREIDGKPMFVVVDTFPRATVHPEAIRKSALELAYRADAVESLLTGRDQH